MHLPEKADESPVSPVGLDEATPGEGALVAMASGATTLALEGSDREGRITLGSSREASSHRVVPKRHGGDYSESESGAMSDGQNDESNARDV